MDYRLILGSFLILFGIVSSGGSLFNLRFERLDYINGKENDYIHFIDVRVKRFNDTTYIVNGTFEIKEDLSDEFQGSLKLHHSPRGNGDFHEVPMHLKKVNMCEFTNSAYKKYVMPEIKGKSNLPQVDEDELIDCPIKKDTYYLKEVLVPEENLPSVEPGLWRADIMIYKGGEDPVAGVMMYIKVEMKKPGLALG